VSILLENILAAVIYAVLGIAIFVSALVMINRLTPGTLWKEIIEEHNTALAILFAGFAISISLVIAAAIF
jgi:uncharacterized membrane protein YjfL (UPF0719 family)